jgi:flagellar hook-length control protein FliK
MNATPLSFASSLPATALPAGDAPSFALSGQTLRGADFANILEHLMDPAGRQGFAAVAGAGLQSLPLSPNIEVITADVPPPDAGSLLAFARSQGLDERMIQSLFVPAESGQAGSPQAIPSPAVTTQTLSAQTLSAQALFAQVATAQVATAQASPTLDASTPALPVQATLAHLPAGALVALSRPLAPQAVASAGPELLPSQEEVPLAVAPSTEVPLSVTGMALPASTASVAPLSQGEAATLGQAVAKDKPVASLQVLAFAGAKLPPGGGMAQSDDQAQTGAAELQALRPVHAARPLAVAPAFAPAEGPDAVPAQVLVTATTAVVKGQDTGSPALADMPQALRLSLQTHEGLAQRLASLAVSGQQARWGELTGPAAAEPLVLSLGDSLDEPVVSDDPTRMETTPAHSGSVGSDSARTSTAATANATPASTAAERAARYEQLAQRLGQALGERLQAQIERGEWKVQMQVDPAHLGRIDMELEMRAGGLDAVFRSDSQLTRELIAQGLPRLKDSLNQSGTTVANVWVQGDSSRQSGGNPTPWRGPSAPARMQGQPEGEPAIESVPGVRTKADGSSWDLMA